MAKNQTKRLTPAILTEDEEIYAAVKVMTDYAPVNPACAVSALDAVRSKLEAAYHTSVQADAAAAAARDNLVAVQWEFHNSMLGTKDQVAAQFGRNSNQIQALKRKKTSEYKAPRRKKKGEGGKE